MLTHIKKQDVSNSKKSLWKTFYKFCSIGRYDKALEFYSNNSDALSSVIYNAALYNIIANNLLYLQGLDDKTFKDDKIKVSDTTPDNMSVGQVYFRTEE